MNLILLIKKDYQSSIKSLEEALRKRNVAYNSSTDSFSSANVEGTTTAMNWYDGSGDIRQPGDSVSVVLSNTFTLDYNYAADLFADYDPSDRGALGPNTWEVPDFHLFDTALRHEFSFGSFDASIIARVNNIFDTTYISDAQDGTNSDAATAAVYYGFGRTFSVGAKIKF